jgi:hypothetical protein
MESRHQPMKTSTGKSIVLAALVLCLCTGGSGARTAEADETRSNVIAAFLYNFLLFTEWPSDKALDRGPYLIGVVGENLFARAAAAIEKRQAGGRAISFRHFPEVDDIEPTHVLFVEDADALPEVRKAVGKRPVLLVGDSDDFTRRGGIIRFYEEPAGKEMAVRVEINRTAADRADIRFRSQLMRLAKIVDHPVPAMP